MANASVIRAFSLAMLMAIALPNSAQAASKGWIVTEGEDPQVNVRDSSNVATLSIECYAGLSGIIFADVNFGQNVTGTLYILGKDKENIIPPLSSFYGVTSQNGSYFSVAVTPTVILALKKANSIELRYQTGRQSKTLYFSGQGSAKALHGMENCEG